MFPIRWNFPFRKKNGALSTIGAEIENAAEPYTLPTASSETKGGVKIGSGLAMEGEVLNNSNPTPYSLPTASSETKGGVMIGSRLTITEGVLSADAQLPSSTSADENKVLTVGSDGTLEWDTPSSGGGLSYLDLSLETQVRVAANSFKSDYYLTIGADSPLIGKRIVNVLTPSASVFCVGVSSYQSDPIALNSQIRLLFYNSHSDADGITALRIFYQ